MKITWKEHDDDYSIGITIRTTKQINMFLDGANYLYAQYCYDAIDRKHYWRIQISDSPSIHIEGSLNLEEMKPKFLECFKIRLKQIITETEVDLQKEIKETQEKLTRLRVLDKGLSDGRLHLEKYHETI